MIELIFVIVILGILASVAIPKLAATRDDAEIANFAQEIQAGTSEIQSFVVAKGIVKRPEEMSQVFATMVSQSKALSGAGSISNSLGKLILRTNNQGVFDNAFVLEVNTTTLVVKYGIPCIGIICQQLQKRISEGNYSIGGDRVKF